MARPARTVICKEQSLTQLRNLASDTSNETLAIRARVILDAIAGLGVDETVDKGYASKSTVIKYRGRYMEQGIQGLYDEDRPGRRGHARDAEAKELSQTIRTMKDRGSSQGVTVSQLAAQHGVTTHMVHRALEREGITLNRQRSWMIPALPDTEPGTLKLVGLFVSRSACSLILSRSFGSTQTASTRGTVRTSRKTTAETLIQTTGSQEPLTMLSALRAVSQERRPKLAKPIDMQHFTQRLVNDLPMNSLEEYHVVFCASTPVSMASTNKIRLLQHALPAIEDWKNYGQMFLEMLCRKDGKRIGSGEFKKAVDDFLANADDHTEAFMWGISKSATTDSPQPQTVSEPASQAILEMTAQWKDLQGNPLCDPVIVSQQVESPDSIDYSSKSALLATMNTTEGNIVKVRNLLGEKVLETTLEMASSKKKS